MKRLLIRLISSLVGIVTLLLLLAYFGAGYSPAYLIHAPSTATGIGAKLACSLHYIVGYDKGQVARDIEVYSPILRFLDYQYDEKNQSVSASLFHIKTRTAHYLPRIGCTLDFPHETTRSTIHWPPLASANAAWPKGNIVLTIRPEIQKKLDALLTSDNANGQDTRALVIVHNGKIVAESYADGISANTPMLGWSMTKSINAVILGHLEMLGMVDVDKDHLFPEWENDERSTIKLKDLLHMADGLDYEEIYDPGESATDMLFEVPDVAKYMRERNAKTEPGKTFNYSSGTANLISYIIQQSIPGNVQADTEFLVDNIFRPMGLTSVTYETDSKGLYMGSSYLYATARDWAKVGQLMLNGGELNGQRIITEEFIKRATTSNNTQNRPGYGYQWWLNTDPNRRLWKDLPDNAFTAKGDRDQRLFVLPDDDLVIVRLGWSDEKYPDNETFRTIRYWFQ